MTSHPDVEALAFFAEDLLDPDEERSVADHIETCATCAVTLDELSGVTRVLAEAPAPALPQNVADLLDGRVAEALSERSAAPTFPSESEATRTPDAPAPTEPAEPGEPGEPGRRSAETPGTPVDETLAPVVPITARRRGFGLPQLMAVAAATVFVVGGGAALVNGLMADEPQMGAASPLHDENAEQESAPDTAQSYSAESVASGTVYTEEGIGSQAAEVLAAAEESTDAKGDDGDTGTQSLEPLPDGAQECVTRYEEANGVRVTLVDDARFDSGDGAERAWVLFTQDTSGGGVVVLDPRTCTQGEVDDAVLAGEPL